MTARTELIAAAAIFLVICAGLFFTWQIDLSFTSDLETFSGPRAYPGLILGIMLVFNLAALGQAAWRLSREAPAISTQQVQTEPHGKIKAATAEISLILFVVAFEHLGYILSMWPLLIAMSCLFGARRPLPIIAVTFLMMITCLLLVRYGLNTVLPEGIFSIDMIL